MYTFKDKLIEELLITLMNGKAMGLEEIKDAYAILWSLSAGPITKEDMEVALHCVLSPDPREA